MAGSSYYTPKNRRFLSPYLTVIARRKILVILTCVLCISLIFFGFYHKRRTQNEIFQDIVPEHRSSHRHSNDEYKNFDIPPYVKHNPTSEKPRIDKQSAGFLEDYEIPAIPLQRDELDNSQFSISESSRTLNSNELYSDESDTSLPITDSDETLEENSHEDNFDSLKLINPLNKTTRLDELFPSNSLNNLKPSKSPRLILDTPGCKIPKLDPWDPSVSNLIQLLGSYVCCGPPLLLYSDINGSIHLNESVLLFHYDRRPYHINCSYRAFFRAHEWPNYPYEAAYTKGDVFDLEFGVPLDEEFVGVTCDLQTEELYYQYFAFPHLKPDIEEDRHNKTPPEHRLNIILVGIDSISKLNFLRHFKKTRAFLKDTMHPFSMRGYTKVGDNTFPNLLPMLTGHHVEHYYNESMAQTYFFDDIDLIWKNYAKNGYRTFYAEDSPHIGTFNYLKRGFNDPPSDYYLRTLMLALEDAPNRENNPKYCMNSQLEPDFIYNYLKDFIKIMNNRPYNAFAMVSKLTHDIPNFASYADGPTVRILEDLWNMKALNNSVLVLFSDHGIRYGEIRYTYIGKFEEIMPFMYIHFPKWFLDQHPDIAKNLEINQERLITLFDVHATMLHLLDLKQDMTSPEMRSMTLGSSLLLEIPADRTCEQANIKEHFCPCQTYEPIEVDDKKVIKAAQALVDDINTQLLPFNDSCAHLEVDTILSARVNDGEDQMNGNTNFYVPHQDYLITFITKPGQAVFDGTVRHGSSPSGYTILGISRINMYRDQSKCINSQKMKIFCFCNS